MPAWSGGTVKRRESVVLSAVVPSVTDSQDAEAMTVTTSPLRLAIRRCGVAAPGLRFGA